MRPKAFRTLIRGAESINGHVRVFSWQKYCCWVPKQCNRGVRVSFEPGRVAQAIGCDMKCGDTVSLKEMKARWAFSEIRSPRLAADYHLDPRVPPLSARIGTATFESLSAADIDALVDIFETFRGNYLKHYLAGVRAFMVEEWSADQLARIYVMSEVDSTGAGRFQTFSEYAVAPRPTGPAARLDPRVAAGSVPSSMTVPTADPLVVGKYKDFQVLIDGYFRGLIFMRSAAPAERIVMLVPVTGA